MDATPKKKKIELTIKTVPAHAKGESVGPDAPAVLISSDAGQQPQPTLLTVPSSTSTGSETPVSSGSTDSTGASGGRKRSDSKLVQNKPSNLLINKAHNDDDATITSTGTWQFQDVQIKMQGLQAELTEKDKTPNSSDSGCSLAAFSDNVSTTSTPEEEIETTTTMTTVHIQQHTQHQQQPQLQSQPQQQQPHPTRIKYEDLKIGRPIGSGASASVKKVKHIPTNMAYALKVIPTDTETTKPKVIVAEIKTLYESDCPYIVTLKDAFYRDGCINILLEYMDYGSLQDLVNRYVIRKKKKLPEEVLSNITMQVLKGLEYLHVQRRTIHRDIKPANILLNSKGEVKLTDFGMAGQARNTLAQMDTFQGTITYMSPERIRGERHSFDSDIWSVGLSLAQCALGHFPYKCIPKAEDDNTGFFDLLDEITHKEKLDLPEEETSPEFREFVWACMRKDPRERPTATELLQMPFIKKYADKNFDLGEWLRKHLPRKKKEKPTSATSAPATMITAPPPLPPETATKSSSAAEGNHSFSSIEHSLHQSQPSLEKTTTKVTITTTTTTTTVAHHHPHHHHHRHHHHHNHNHGHSSIGTHDDPNNNNRINTSPRNSMHRHASAPDALPHAMALLIAPPSSDVILSKSPPKSKQDTTAATATATTTVVSSNT